MIGGDGDGRQRRLGLGQWRGLGRRLRLRLDRRHGRRRPWRLTHIGFTHGSMADDAESAQASDALARLLWDRWLDRIEAIKARKSRFEGPWEQVTSGTENLAYVTPEDIKAVGMEVMRHRIVLTYEAEAEDVLTENVVQRIFDSVEVP